MNKSSFFLLFIVVMFFSCKKDKPENESLANFPFPNHANYAGDYIQPTNYDQKTQDFHLKSFYTNWKDLYLKNDCNSDQYYVYSGEDAMTISEAHGYGMMITCMMAGYDQMSKTYFDGMYRYFKAHPSNINSHLMDWQQLTCNDNNSEDDDAASDGDIDIAFALLMADKQWGSDGDINYRQEALTTINAIMQEEINHETWSVKLGDWSDSSEPNYYYGTRSSDFITSHFKSFALATGDANWNLVVDQCYEITDMIQNSESATTGLMPDFILHTNTTPTAAGANYLEDQYDGKYYYNACRFPWRIGTDYLVNNDNRAKNAVLKINAWLRETTGGNPELISNGYQLDGSPIYDWNDATFLGPFAVGAMADTDHQEWLNALYAQLINENDLSDGDYFSNTIKLLSLFVISGNYWG